MSIGMRLTQECSDVAKQMDAKAEIYARTLTILENKMYWIFSELMLEPLDD